MRAAVALAALLLALVVSAGCTGGGSEPSATEWADSFCTATVTWSNELQPIADDVSDISSLSSETIAQAVQQAGTATDEYVEEVRNLGAPDTESRDEVEESLETMADEIEGERAEIEDALEDADGLADLASAGREIGASLAAMFLALEGALESFENADVDGELQTAFEESDACAEIAD